MPFALLKLNTKVLSSALFKCSNVQYESLESGDWMIDDVVRKSALQSKVMKSKALSSGALRLKFKLNGLTPNCK